MYQFLTTYHAPTLSQLVSSQIAFVSSATSFRHSYFLSYKHMYYIYNVCLNLVGNNCMHPPSLNHNDVENILKLNPF
jgi:hypothetical protein